MTRKKRISTQIGRIETKIFAKTRLLDSRVFIFPAINLTKINFRYIVRPTNQIRHTTLQPDNFILVIGK